MLFVYHKVPKNMAGDILCPLNVLKKTYPDLYDQEIKKYKGREKILDRRLPLLNCLWNDVLHFSTVHPREIKEALVRCGYDKFDYDFFEIDIGKIDSKKAIIFTYEHVLASGGVVESDFIPFDAAFVKSHTHLPKETEEYFLQMVKVGREPLLFHGIPHVLLKDSIDISDVKIISL